MSYIKEVDHQNIESKALTVQPDIKIADPVENKNGEIDPIMSVSEAVANSLEKDISIVRTTYH